MNPFKRLAAAMVFTMLPVSIAVAVRAEIADDTLVQAWAIDDIISLDPAQIFEFAAAEGAGNSI